MWAKFYLAVVVVGMIMLVEVVPIAQSAEDDSGSCESCQPSTLTQAMNIVRERLQVLKNLIGINEPQNCASNQEQTSAANASSLCEYIARLNTFVNPVIA